MWRAGYVGGILKFIHDPKSPSNGVIVPHGMVVVGVVWGDCG